MRGQRLHCNLLMRALKEKKSAFLGVPFRVSDFFGLLLLALSSCTPSLEVVPTIHSAPSVEQLEDHLTCQLAYAIKYAEYVKQRNDNASPYPLGTDKEDEPAWVHLIDDDFVASFSLTVLVTETEGLNPSFSFITPLTNVGKVISPILPSSASAMGTSNTYNRTLAVGFQLDGSQDRNVIVNFSVDMVALKQVVDNIDKPLSYWAVPGQANTLPKAVAILRKCSPSVPQGMDGVTKLPLPANMSYGLNGDVEIGSTINDGLAALDSNRFFQPTSSAEKLPGSSGVGSQQSQASGASFSSKVDFSIVWGVNGGPNWTWLSFKGPGGGSGSGGSAGGGGGAGGGGTGGGGGGGGQLINFNRSKLDTLVVTFSPVCSLQPASMSLEKTAITKDFSKDLARESILTNPSATFGNVLMPVGDPPTTKTAVLTIVGQGNLGSAAAPADIQLLVNVPINRSGIFNDPNGSIIEDTNPPEVPGAGKVTWQGVIYKTSNQNAIASITLAGTIIDINSGSPVGQITLLGKISGNTIDWNPTSVTDTVVRSLMNSANSNTENTPFSYWDSLPACNLVTGAARDKAISNNLNGNLLQLSSPELRNSYLQQ